MITISIGSDHAAFELKSKIKDYLESKGHLVNDRGTYSKESCDYADFAHLVAEDVSKQNSVFGILLCGSGNGINMTANKWQDVRSALCWNSEITKMARLHNDANILTLPGRYISGESAFECVDVFLTTEFEGGRHKNRINKIPLRVDKNNFFFSEKTSRTPYISIDKNKSKMEIIGRSIPENPIEFYKNFPAIIEGFGIQEITIDVDLEYFNSSSSKCLYNMFSEISQKTNSSINWFVEEEDEDMIEFVQEISSKFKIKMKIKDNV